MENNEFHKKTFSNLDFGDDFVSNGTILISHDFFHVLGTKFQSKEGTIMIYNEFPLNI